MTAEQQPFRKIIHIDMDCFYAAIEIRDNPLLKDKPVAVGGSATQRGVLCTCNYLAREYGIHSAMPTAVALRLCPSLEVLPVQMNKYREISTAINRIFHQFTDLVEPLSLDEAFDLVEQFNAEAELNDSYTFSERKGRGYMTLKKTTKCGLYDPWMGAGSLLELELEKDVKLHFKCVDSILPDGGRGYSISDIYGMCESAWTNNAVTLVHPMEKTA